MNRNSLNTMLLTAAMLAQSIVAGWGNSHTHSLDGLASHTHRQHDAFDHHEHEPSPHPPAPTGEEDCSICRHLATAAILSLQVELIARGDVFEVSQSSEDILLPTLSIGLYRPRSPPALS